MVDFFGNSSGTHVELDMKAITITKHKSSFQDWDLKNQSATQNDFLVFMKFKTTRKNFVVV